MQRVLTSALVTITLVQGSLAYGHGFTLKLENNSILPTGASVFNHVLTGAHDAAHGGVRANTTFDGTSPQLRLEFSGGLWFSDGGPAVPAPISINALNTFNSDDVTISGSGPSTTQLAVSGTDSHEILWTLLSANPTPGVYGLSYKVAGSGTGGPFNNSPPLVVAFHTLNFDTNPNLAAAQAAVALAAVPEPTSLGLAAIALSSLAIARRRMRQGVR